MPALIAALVLLAVILLIVWSRWRQAARADYIRSFVLPPGLYDKLRKRRPELEMKDCQLVARGLRQFFLAYLRGGRRYVAMPSQVVDDLWHEFILYTKNYAGFCDKAFGGFLHHTPAIVLGGDRQHNAGLRRCWWFACKEENIDPRAPSRLPLLFALDVKLGIPDGFRYSADCEALRRQGVDGVHCGGDFSSSDFDGGTDGFGDGGSDAGGDGGCGGGGCGGGGD